MPFFAISKSKKAFQDYKRGHTFKGCYWHPLSAWMDFTLLKEWFCLCTYICSQNTFKIYSWELLIGNAPSHSSETELEKEIIKAMFLPSIQSMDEGVIELLQRGELLLSIRNDCTVLTSPFYFIFISFYMGEARTDKIALNCLTYVGNK